MLNNSLSLHEFVKFVIKKVFCEVNLWKLNYWMNSNFNNNLKNLFTSKLTKFKKFKYYIIVKISNVAYN